MSTVLIGGPAAPPSPQQTGGGSRPGAAGAFGDALGTALGDPGAPGDAAIGGQSATATDAGAQLAPADAPAPNTGLSALAALLARITGGSKQGAAVATTIASTASAAPLSAGVATAGAQATPTAGATSATPTAASSTPVLASAVPAAPAIPLAGGGTLVSAGTPGAGVALTAPSTPAPVDPNAASPAAPTSPDAASAGKALTGIETGGSTPAATDVTVGATTLSPVGVAPVVVPTPVSAAAVDAGVAPAAAAQAAAALSGTAGPGAPAGPARPGRAGKSSAAEQPLDPGAAAAATQPQPAATPSAALSLVPVASAPAAPTPNSAAVASASASTAIALATATATAASAPAAAAPVLLSSAAVFAAPASGTSAAATSAQPLSVQLQSVPAHAGSTPPPPAFGTPGTPASGFAQIVAAATATDPSASSSAPAAAAPTVADAGSTAAQLTQLTAVAPLQQTAAPVQVNAQASTTAQPTLAQQLQEPLLSLRSAPDGDHVVVVTVTPDHLGPVTVHATVSHGDLTVQLFAPTSDARDALKSMLSDLRRDLGSGTAGTATTLSLGSGDAPQQDARGQNAPGWAGAGGFGGSGQGARWGARDDAQLWTATPAANDPTTFRTQHRGSGLLDVLA